MNAHILLVVDVDPNLGHLFDGILRVAIPAWQDLAGGRKRALRPGVGNPPGEA